MPKSSKQSLKATIILALIGSILPPTLNNRTTKDVSLSLECIVKDPAKYPYRLLAIELIGMGFKGWESHLNGQDTVRYLLQLTGLAGQHGHALTIPNMMMSRQALLDIARSNTGLFVSTLTYDLLHAKDSWECVGALKLLGLFVSKVKNRIEKRNPSCCILTCMRW